MFKLLFLSLLCLFTCALVYSHEGHQILKQQTGAEVANFQNHNEQVTVKESGGRPQSWTQWIGTFHFVFLHFPIALIVMTAVSEFFYVRYHMPVFDYSARFMIVVAAIMALPTALLGYTYSTTMAYHGILENYIWWHMVFGISTALLAIVVAYMRLQNGLTRAYYFSLILLFILVNVTALLGADMTFGINHMNPPL